VTIPNSTAAGTSAYSGTPAVSAGSGWPPTPDTSAPATRPWRRGPAPAPQVVYLYDPAFERIAKALERLTELLEAKL
jgi:hypothetical protein